MNPRGDKAVGSVPRRTARRIGGQEGNVATAPCMSALDHHTGKITDAWDRHLRCRTTVVRSIVDVGHELMRAKRALPRGFVAMVRNRLPFDVRTAQRYMKIARHPVLADATHESHLPSDSNTLCVLAKAPEATLLAWLADATVSPSLTQEEARLLLRPRPKALDLGVLRLRLNAGDDNDFGADERRIRVLRGLNRDGMEATGTDAEGFTSFRHIEPEDVKLRKLLKLAPATWAWLRERADREGVTVVGLVRGWIAREQATA